MKTKSSFLALVLPLFLAFACVSCYQTGGIYQQVSYHKDGRAKPKVLLMPVIASCEAEFPWSLSQEFTEGLQSRFLNHSNIYLMQDFSGLEAKIRENSDKNILADDNTWIKSISPNTEFVILIELVDHNLVPKQQESLFNIKNSPAYNLEMCMRAKVVDLRHGKPEIILHELFTENYHIPWQLSSIDYTKTVWGKTSFFLSPMGLAHAQMIKKVTQQVEDYILLAKTR